MALRRPRKGMKIGDASYRKLAEPSIFIVTTERFPGVTDGQATYTSAQ